MSAAAALLLFAVVITVLAPLADYLPTGNHHASRQERRFATHEPPSTSPTLTPLEAHADALLRFENFERYVAQSAATRDGVIAELPERETLTLPENTR